MRINVDKSTDKVQTEIMRKTKTKVNEYDRKEFTHNDNK